MSNKEYGEKKEYTTRTEILDVYFIDITRMRQLFIVLPITVALTF